MPKAQSKPGRHSRPSAPYNLRTTTTTNQQLDMGDPWSQHSPAPWSQPQYPQFPPAVMSSGPDYSHPMLTPSLHQSALPTPVMPYHRSARHSHSRQPSQSAPWTEAEDDALRRARQKGLGWSAIQEQYFPGKSGNACRKRYERVMVKNRGADWDEPKLEILASRYNVMRSQIWQPLADALGEKWETVEKVCMQQGLKTLKTKASNHLRNQSSSGSSVHRISSDFERSSPHDEFDDSGYQEEAVGLGVRSNGQRPSLQNSASLGNILHGSHESFRYQ